MLVLSERTKHVKGCVRDDRRVVGEHTFQSARTTSPIVAVVVVVVVVVYGGWVYFVTRVLVDKVSFQFIRDAVVFFVLLVGVIDEEFFVG